MFVLQSGRYAPAKMEYSYARRSQSVTYSLQWKDVALIDTLSAEEAVKESKDAISEWKKQGFTAERWRVEGRGKCIQQCLEIKTDNA